MQYTAGATGNLQSHEEVDFLFFPVVDVPIRTLKWATAVGARAEQNVAKRIAIK